MRENVIKNIEEMLSNITGIPQSISEDTILYGMAQDKIDACSLELASWFADIESKYEIEIPIDILRVADIVDRVVEKIGEEK